MNMKRIDLTASVYYGVIDKLGIRPSLKMKINYYLSENDIKCVCALCDKTEDELLKIEGIDEEIITGIKDYLDTVGLHLGMTDEEIVDYVDADFLDEQSKAAEQKKKGQEKQDRLLSLKILCVMLLFITPPAIGLVYFVHRAFFYERPTIEEVRRFEGLPFRIVQF